MRPAILTGLLKIPPLGGKPKPTGGVDPNDAPVLDLNGDTSGNSVTRAYSAGDPLTRIAPHATAFDIDSPDFHGGCLRASFTGNGTATDQLAIITDATVTLTGNDHAAVRAVKIDGVLIGTVSGGQNGTDLTIKLNKSATAAQVETLLQHVGYANSSDAPSTLPRTVTFTLVDGDGVANGGSDTAYATATITYGSANAAPILTGDCAAEITEGGVYTLTSADLCFTDPDDSPADVTFTVSNPLNGAVRVNGVAALSFTGQQLLDGVVTFEHDGSESSSAFFDVVAEDGNEDSSAPVSYTFTFAVTPVNDQPVVAGNLAATVNEGDSYTLTAADLSVSDADDSASEVTFTLSDALNGIVRVNGIAAVSFTGQQLLDGLVSFEHDGSEAGTAGLVLHIDDGDEDGSGPVVSSFTFTVLPSNDPPVIVGDLIADVVQGGSCTLAAADLGFADPDDVATDVTYTVSNQVNGVVKVDGLAATSFTGQQLLDGLVKFTHDGSSSGAASFDVTLEDGDEDGSPAGTTTFNLAVRSADIDLTTLTAAQGFVIRGDAAADNAGWSVSSAGDVNGDGFDDLLVGSPNGDNGGTDAGEAYLIFGKASGFNLIDLTNLTPTDGLIIQGDAAGDHAGWSVSAAGDVNNDGVGDLIIGSYTGDDGGMNAGEAYVVFGSSTGFGAGVIDLSALGSSAGFIIQGDAPIDWAGYDVSAAGDVNGDGFGDIIVGAPLGDDGGGSSGEAYVVFGKSSEFGTIDLTNLGAADGFVIQGDAIGDHAGESVSAAGDINGDGMADLIVGAPNGHNGGTDAGEAYVLFGKTSVFGSDVAGRQVVDLTSLSPTDGFIIQGDSTFDQAGQTVAAAGDVNGDGIGDLIVGAHTANGGSSSEIGEAYVLFGKDTGFGTVVDLTFLSASDGFIIRGDMTNDQAGWSVSGIGDFNGDGFDDLVVGAPLGDNGGTDAGEADVLFGKESGFGTTVGTRQVIDLGNLSFPDGFILQGDAAGDHAGWSVSAGGDINNDGFADLVLGAPLGDDGGTNAGEAYVIFGSAFWSV